MGSGTTFTHRDAGTDESTWLLDPRWEAVPRLAIDELVAAHPNVVLVAPHPDDETLALGAILADLSACGATVTVAVVTHGGQRPELTVRRREATRAVAALSPRISMVWWDFPDGGTDAEESDIEDRLADMINECTLLFAPIDFDGHSDHEAVARAAEGAAQRRRATLLGYPVWLWHWSSPDAIDWTRLRVLAPTLTGLKAKDAAIGCYPSQLTSDDGFPVVGSAMLARARRVFETVIVPDDPELAARVTAIAGAGDVRGDTAKAFDAMLADGNTDPWHLDSSPYERRRLAIVLACLGREHYPKALEIGCSTGQLSRALRRRADDVVGLDASPRALNVARKGCERVRWTLGTAPQDIPEEEFDLIVLSEVTYFLDGPELLTTLRTVRRLLRGDGEIVIANWQRPTSDIPLDGPTVDRQAIATLDLPLRARYADADLAVHVWGSPMSVFDDSGRADD